MSSQPRALGAAGCAQDCLKQVLTAAPARIFTWQDLVAPFAADRMSDGVTADAAVLEFTGMALDGFVVSLD